MPARPSRLAARGATLLACVGLAIGVLGPAALAADAKGKLPRTGNAAGFKGKAAHIYTLYFEHCKHYTWRALAYPLTAHNAAQAALLFAGPPREFRPPAFRGCLAGLSAGEATINVKRLQALIAADDDGG